MYIYIYNMFVFFLCMSIYVIKGRVVQYVVRVCGWQGCGEFARSGGSPHGPQMGGCAAAVTV